MMPLEFARYLLLGLIVVEFSVALLVSANTSASAVTKERESKTLDLLLVTPITSRYYIWGKLRGLVSFMLPFAAVPTITIILVVLYDLAAGAHFAASGASAVDPITGIAANTFWLRMMFNPWVLYPETILTTPLLLTVMLSWACMLGLQLSLKWSRTIVAVMASVGVLAGICTVLGVCGFTAAHSMGMLGPVVAAFSPFTAIAVLIDPMEYAPAYAATDGATAARITFFIAILFAATAYCLIVWAMYRSMVKNFDMIIRRQHQ